MPEDDNGSTTKVRRLCRDRVEVTREYYRPDEKGVARKIVDSEIVSDSKWNEEKEIRKRLGMWVPKEE